MQIPAFATVILALAGLLTLPDSAFAQEVEESVWGKMPDGREVRRFVLTNAQKTRVEVAEFGALLISVETVDLKGESGRLTLSYGNLEEALAGGVFGSVIGRFANRISGGGFTLDGQRYDLESVSKEGVHIHGGQGGFHRQLWHGQAGKDAEGTFVVLALTSENGDEGYPGKVEVEVAYRLTNDNILRIDYRGTTDKPTHLNLTNHAYFNLAGKGDIRGHVLEMMCGEMLAVDPRKIPTGAILNVAGTPFDFRVPKAVGRDVEAVEGGGYDHCFVIPRNAAEKVSALIPFAKLSDPGSGRTMEIATTKPGVQVFTANHFKGNPYPRWGGICFETQFYPDTPNQPKFPSSVLRPGELYHHTTEFRFGNMGE